MAPGKTTSLRMLTWNVQMLPEITLVKVGALRKRQSERTPWIIDYLKQQPFDVICLQEMMDPVIVKKFEEGLKDIYPYYVPPQYIEPRKGRLLPNGVAFYSRAPITHVAHVTFEELVGIEVMTSKGCCLIEGEKDGVKFMIAGAHFPTGGQYIKDAAVINTAENLIKPFRKPGIPLFFMGDFNTTKGEPQYDVLLKTCEVSDIPVNDPKPYSVDGENSWKRGKNNPALIDHVLINPMETASRLVELRIQRERHTEDGNVTDLADHYGVIADALITNAE